MKSLLTLVILFVFSSLCMAQQGINYKAIIKDNIGNVLVNTEIEVKFTILQDAINVYQESHILTTDANGLIIINIGEGNPTPSSGGAFNAINWADDTTFLNTQVRTGFSFIDLGTTAFNAVPYAKHAETAANVSGLEALNEGNGIGWRLKGRNPQNYGDIGENAVDLSIHEYSSGIHGATGISSTAMGSSTTASGFYSTAMGRNTTALEYVSTAMGYYTTASGENSTAMGYYTIASGENSTAMGERTTASNLWSIAMGYNTKASADGSTAMGVDTQALGNASTTMGFNTKASGSASTAMGYYTTASSYGSLAMGRYNVGGGSLTTWVATDRLFEVGNGTSNSNKSNAFTVFKNGNATLAGTLTQNSDRRLKKDIRPLPYGLETVLALNPVAYNWKKNTQTHKTLGLIAQEIQPIINEIVHIADDEEQTLSISYTELIPVLIKAIQEQQDIIKKQHSKIENLTAESNQKDETMKAFDIRLKQLETVVKLENQ